MQRSRQLVPDFIYEKYRAGETNGMFQGAAMFVDLSGFSAMAEVLSARGSHGAEMLADMMRVVFEPLVNAVYEQGGFVIGYVGDAFNAVFPAGQDSGQAMKRCLSSALAMQMHTKSHSQVSTPYGGFSIRIKVGLGFGKTTWQIFKSTNGKRASYWFRGKSLNGAVSGEESAHAGDIVADSIAYELLKDIVRATPVDDCFLIQDIHADLPTALPLSPPKPADDLVGIFFADSISHLPIAGEFRQVVNLFIDIPAGISDEALIAPFMETVYLLQEQYGGFFLRPDLGDKGFNLLMFWGAPTTYENDVERALNFILELSSRTRITLRAGISYHMAYAGFMGSSQREDYTAYGWGVNLAARMMERAGEGEYWMDEEAARRAGKYFNLKSLGKYRFKGFKHEQKAFALLGRRNVIEAVYQGQLVGRNKELESLAYFVEPIKQGQFAGMMVLKGEAGIGKSRLVHSFQYSEYFNDFPAHWVVCQTDEILRLSFNPFKDWLKKRFELLESQSNEVNLAAFSRNIQNLIETTSDTELAAELTRTSSVLAALVNINQPNSFYESLDAKGRYDNTLIALGLLLRAESLQKPLILFLEDTHWLDEDTGAFLSYFVRTLLIEPDKQYPIAIIATQRPEGDSVRMMDEVSMYGIKLGRLSSANMARLAEDSLDHPIADSLLTLLNARADGNPFFAEHILRYLLEQNALTLDANGKYFANAQAEISLPLDVRAVLVARLDRLTQHVRETVQTASVLGREFEVRILSQMLHTDDNFLLHVTQAENANVWTPLTENEYIFRHALLRDAAYSMQLLARQRELHGLAVSAMETVYRDNLESHYSELAYHAEKADLKEKALNYLKLAGQLSLSVYQNQQAIDHFTRALTFVSSDDLRVKLELLLARVECNYNISNSTEQLKDLDVLEELARSLNDDELLARVFMRQSYRLSTLGDFQKVVAYATQAKELAEKANDHATVFATYMVTPIALLRTGKIAEAMQHGQEGLLFSRNKSDRYWEARALTVLGLIALEKEGPTIAQQYQEQALVIARQVNNKYLEALVLNNLANTIGLSLGDFHTSRKYFEDAFSILQEQGNLSGQGIALTNLGWVAGILGDYKSAENYHKQAMSIARTTGNRIQELYTYVNLSAAAGGQKSTEDALKWSTKALDLSEELGDRTGEAWAYFSLGHAYLLINKFDESAQVFLKSIEIRLDLNVPILVAEARAGLIESYLGLNDEVLAKSGAEQVFQYMENDKAFEGAEEPLRIYFALFRVLEKIRDPRMAVVLQNAIQLLNAQVSKLRSEEARVIYVENVPWRHAIQQTARANGLGD